MDQFTPPKPRASTIRWPAARALRAAHRYCGILFAPTLLFFAASGILQVFDLHKPHAWASGEPPALVRTLATLHKHQALAPAPKDAPARLGPSLLKGYAAGASAALAASTLAGLMIAWRDARGRVRLVALTAAGILLPVALMLLR